MHGLQCINRGTKLVYKSININMVVGGEGEAHGRVEAVGVLGHNVHVAAGAATIRDAIAREVGNIEHIMGHVRGAEPSPGTGINVRMPFKTPGSIACAMLNINHTGRPVGGAEPSPASPRTNGAKRSPFGATGNIA